MQIFHRGIKRQRFKVDTELEGDVTETLERRSSTKAGLEGRIIFTHQTGGGERNFLEREDSMTSKLQALWNHPAGPKTSELTRFITSLAYRYALVHVIFLFPLYISMLCKYLQMIHLSSAILKTKIPVWRFSSVCP